MVNIALGHIVGKLLRLQKQHRASAAMHEEHPIFNPSCTALVDGESPRDLRKFLGVELRPLTSRRRRLDPPGFRQKIKNHRKAREALNGIWFEGIL